MRTVLFALLLSLAGASQASTYGQADLEALLAPLVAYPEEVAAHMLVAASYPDQVSDAARGVPPQPHWHPSVVALLPYPDILQRMAESPDWMRDVAWLHVYRQQDVLGTLQALRARHMPPPPMMASPPVIVQNYYYPALIVPRLHFHGHRHFDRHKHSQRHYRPVPEAKRRPIISSTPQVSKPRPPQARRPSGFNLGPSFQVKRR
jgi:hypothetical protein